MTFPNGSEGEAARQKHWNKRVEEAVNARKEYEQMSESVKQQAAAMRELQNSPEFLDFYNRMRSGDYVIGQSGMPNPQSHGNDRTQEDPFEDFDPLTADASQYGKMIESKVGALLDEKLGQLAGVIKPMAEWQHEQTMTQQEREIQSMAQRYPDFAQHKDSILADVSRYGIPLDKAYRMHGNGVTADEAAKIRAAQQPTLGGYGSPPRGEEKARSLEDAFRLNAEDGIVDAVLSGRNGTQG
jgi:hypothetical protein